MEPVRGKGEEDALRFATTRRGRGALRKKFAFGLPGRTNPKSNDGTAELIKTTNEDIAQARTELLFFLGTIAFILLTIFGIDDRALLIGTRINLPIFGISTDLSSFLFGSPLLLTCIHFVILLKFRNLGAKCHAIEALLAKMRRGDPVDAQGHQLHVTSNFLTQWVIGSRDDRLFSFFNSFVYLVCLYVAPIATLLFLMLRTLPLHNNHLTTFQSVILFVDIWLSLFVVRKPRAWLSTAIAAFSALFAALLLSVPDGPQDRFGRRYLVSAPVPFGMLNATRRAFWPTAFLLESEVDLATSHPVRWFSRNLVVVNAHIGPSENDTRVVSIQDGSHPNGRPSIPIELRPNLGARNLRYAILDYTNLRGANLIAADLTGASLRYAGLADALLGCTARGVGANDRITKAAKANCTKFDGANLEGVQLVRAVDLTTFDGELSHSASFADANLSLANLQDADVPFLILDRADLSDAMLLGANLSYASLIGANLSGANLAGATMRTVNAAFAVFVGASLIGADLKTSYFEIANFDSADLAGANFEDARMWGANFRNAHLWASNPPDKESVSWVDFTNAHSERPSESDIQAFEQILNWLRSDSRFTGTMTFTELFKHTKDTEEPEANSEGVWKSWITSLAVSNADIAYRLALSRLITEVGCRDGQSARALERWSIIPAQAEVNRGPTQEEAAPEVDHRLDKLPDRESSPYEWGYSSYDVPVSPIPTWYDLNGFLDALSNPTTCKAAGAVSPELVISIKNQATMRKAQSASR